MENSIIAAAFVGILGLIASLSAAAADTAVSRVIAGCRATVTFDGKALKIAGFVAV